ncbi:type IIL restriction-modification enzyme MmeI [Methylomarinum vadi]|uniref:type IIL restriction-modification enzyme MmeI n=1 Tax=Methylomarinum vadi TaxID=438855 RepID=UPI001F46BD89|nr:type IIL restriction-modification enzyme MmeI [Methylomarinum vadi]
MIEVSGPFLAVAVLEKIFPQGLESLDTYGKKRIRSAYEEWREAVEEDDPQLLEMHRAWIELVLKELLEYEGLALILATDDFTYKSPDGDGRFKPDYVLKRDGSPMMFLSVLPEGTDLEKVTVGDGWPVPVFERMTLLCRDKGVQLGLVTNGERWMLVNAPVGSTSSHVSWYARLWFQEPVTLKAFQSLLGVRRWFGPEDETLPAILEDSLQHHEEVTDTLGEQVKRAVEVLVQCLDKADQDRNRELLHDVPPAELYEAGLTVMMRLVFVLCAEERGLLLLDDPVYDQHYAITTLRGQLAEEADQHGHEVLERRHVPGAGCLPFSEPSMAVSNMNRCGCPHWVDRFSTRIVFRFSKDGPKERTGRRRLHNHFLSTTEPCCCCSKRCRSWNNEAERYYFPTRLWMSNKSGMSTKVCWNIPFAG